MSCVVFVVDELDKDQRARVARAPIAVGACCSGATGICLTGIWVTLDRAGASVTTAVVAALTQAGWLSENETGSLHGSAVAPRTLRTRTTQTPACVGPSP